MTQYDYIVIDAGSAGCANTNRLTEDSETTVLYQFTKTLIQIDLW
jgi:choline dehydrogenase-like flavoprotein